MHSIYARLYYGTKDMCGLSRDMDHMEMVYIYPHTNIYQSGKVHDNMSNICIPTIMIPWKFKYLKDINKYIMHYLSPGKHVITKIHVNCSDQIIVCKHRDDNSIYLDNNIVIVFIHMNFEYNHIFVQSYSVTDTCLDNPINLDLKIVSTSTLKVECI